MTIPLTAPSVDMGRPFKPCYMFSSKIAAAKINHNTVVQPTVKDLETLLE